MESFRFNKMAAMTQLQITPQPTPAEIAAILAAHEALWPKAAQPQALSEPNNRWRFSGRWWVHSARPGRWGLS